MSDVAKTSPGSRTKKSRKPSALQVISALVVLIAIFFVALAIGPQLCSNPLAGVTLFAAFFGCAGAVLTGNIFVKGGLNLPLAGKFTGPLGAAVVGAIVGVVVVKSQQCSLPHHLAIKDVPTQFELPEDKEGKNKKKYFPVVELDQGVRLEITGTPNGKRDFLFNFDGAKSHQIRFRIYRLPAFDSNIPSFDIQNDGPAYRTCRIDIKAATSKPKSEDLTDFKLRLGRENHFELTFDDSYFGRIEAAAKNVGHAAMHDQHPGFNCVKAASLEKHVNGPLFINGLDVWGAVASLSRNELLEFWWPTMSLLQRRPLVREIFPSCRSFSRQPKPTIYSY